jgi:hypothetical protein
MNTQSGNQRCLEAAVPGARFSLRPQAADKLEIGPGVRSQEDPTQRTSGVEHLQKLGLGLVLDRGSDELA